MKKREILEKFERQERRIIDLEGENSLLRNMLANLQDSIDHPKVWTGSNIPSVIIPTVQVGTGGMVTSDPAVCAVSQTKDGLIYYDQSGNEIQCFFTQ